MASFSDDFAGSGALGAGWSAQGFNTATRVSGVAALPEYSWNLVVQEMDGAAQVVEYTLVDGTVQVTLSSETTAWEFPFATGYSVQIRADGIVECFRDAASLGYEFITIADGSVVRVEHDGEGVVTLYDDDVLMKTWTDPDPPAAGTFVWLTGGEGQADNFSAADGGSGPPGIDDDFADAFDRADGALGADWEAMDDGPSSVVAPVIVSNRAQPAAVATNTGALAVGSWGDFQWAALDARLGPDYAEVWVGAHGNANERAYFFVWCTDGEDPLGLSGWGTIDGPAFQLYEHTPGSVGAVIAAEAVAPAPDGTDHRMLTVALEESVQGWFDGVLVLEHTYTSTAVSIPGRPGMSAFQQAGTITTSIDNFACGGFEDAPTAPTFVSLLPADAVAGDTVTVTGTGFHVDATMVTIDGIDVAVAVASATSGTFVVPAVTPDTHDVTVTSIGGESGDVPLTVWSVLPPVAASLVEIQNNSNVGHTSITVPAPAGLNGEDGEVVVLAVLAVRTSAGAPTWTPPAGFTQVGITYESTALAGFSAWVYLAAFESTGDQSAEDDFTLGFTSSVSSRLVAVRVRHTAGSSDIGNVGQLGAPLGGTNTFATPAVDSADDNALAIGVGHSDPTFTLSTPSAWSLLDAGNLALWTQRIATPGSSGTTSTTMSGGNFAAVTTLMFEPMALDPVEVAAVPAAVHGVAGTGTIDAQADVDVSPAVVAVVAGQAVAAGQADVVAVPTVVEVSSAVATIGAHADVVPTGAVVDVYADIAEIVGAITVVAVSAIVDIAAESAPVGGQADITGSPAVVDVAAAVAEVLSASTVVASTGVVHVAAGSVTVGARADVVAVPALVEPVAAVATVAGQADVVVSASAVEVVAGVGDVSAAVGVIATTAVVQVAARVAVVAGIVTVTPRTVAVRPVAALGPVGAQADITAIAAVVLVYAAIAQITIGKPGPFPVASIVTVLATTTAVTTFETTSADVTFTPLEAP